MSHILLKQVQDNLISAPASNYVKVFSNDSDGGLLYYMNSSGNAIAVGAGSYNPVIDITYPSLYSLYTSNGFATGSYYNITDFQTIYDQPDFYVDDTPKSVLDNKTSTTQPIFVLATSKNTLAPDAYQPDYPKDKIKYDITWNFTELGNDAKGRITERIDEFGNRTDYDHRTITFKRYADYERFGATMSGYITDYNCVTGLVTGSGTSFNSTLVAGDIILLNSNINYGGDVGHTIGLKVKTTPTGATSMYVEVDSLYTVSVPADVLLGNGTYISTEDYTFTGKSYTFHKSTAIGTYASYKEVYFGQSDEGEFNETVTFQSGSINNRIGNYSQVYLSGNENNCLILSNNVFDNVAVHNEMGDVFYNNHFYNPVAGNKIGNNFYNNIIIDSFYYNIITNTFNNNFLGAVQYNSFFGEFINNVISYNTSIIRYNTIKTPIISYNLGSPTHLSGNYNCEVFSNQSSVVRLAYWDGSDSQQIVNITD